MHVPSANGNKYMMTFIDYYTRMRWIYLLKNKFDAFQTFKNFHTWIEMMHNLILDLFALIMEKNTHQMNLKTIFTNMGSNIKQLCLIIPNRMV